MAIGWTGLAVPPRGSDGVDVDFRGMGSSGRAGVVSALLAAALFGASTPLARMLVGSVPPVLLAGLLYLGSGLGLLVTWVSRRRAAVEAPLTRRDLPWLAGAIAFGGAAGPVLLMTGLASTSGAVASLLLNFEGVLTAVLAWFLFRENFDRRIALGMLAIVAGGILLSWEGDLSGGRLGPGSLLIIGACLCWALDNNLTQKVSASDPVQIAGLKGGLAGLVNLAIGLGTGASLPGARVVAAALVVGFLGYGLSLVLYVLSLRHLGTARTGAYFSMAPFLGAAASFALLREAVPATFWLALVLMGIGAWLHLSERHEHVHTHADLEHDHLHEHDEHHQHGHETEPHGSHSHPHRHDHLEHSHPHYPDLHHRHGHA